jgi:hypothetical protein
MSVLRRQLVIEDSRSLVPQLVAKMAHGGEKQRQTKLVAPDMGGFLFDLAIQS